jgi:hypothetical protein
MLSENHKIIAALPPAADAFAATKATDIIALARAHDLTFIVYHNGGTTGTTTLTVLACDDFTPSNTSAIVFQYRKLYPAVGEPYDEAQAWAWATTAGVVTTAALEEIVEIKVFAADLPAGYPNVKLVATELVDDPVSGAIIAILGEQRYGGAEVPTDLS